MTFDIWSLLAALAACALGGVLKGATGAGAPVIGVPVLAALFNVQLAVVIFAVPNLLTNIWQSVRFRQSLLPGRFVLLFAGGGALGVVFGTYLLDGLPSDALSLAMALAVLAYVGFRVLKADWRLAWSRGLWIAGPAGLVGGILQGATGISAPASLTFLNALKVERRQFVATISVFFAVMSAAQLERMIALELMSFDRFMIGLGATGAVLAGMPVGQFLARRIQPHVFDKIILALLTILALKILVELV
ncbi:hypothetical protein JM93_00678 [Roseibium hamelinense]|uniref:Probable membrane transporter protein n=1 Tax=Roseibium hamelinense TaxID=150831 RepID=A0A562TID1_9HYPH|nr:sulfite exporter TauE/SafE family protein [Roseibium hamelinense]MTI45694.1 sulfite exporter TauE/SafE family protein [Roseibium hamelinense]TWI93123.1 hypothetical protein JM93_00678 [Roseibium hamelinense]